MSTTSSQRAGASTDSPSQAANRKVCQSEDRKLAETLRQEQTVAVADIHERLNALESQGITVGADLEKLKEAQEPEELDERIAAFKSLTDGLAEVRAALQAQEEKMSELGKPDTLMDTTVRDLRRELNGILEREATQRRAINPAENANLAEDATGVPINEAETGGQVPKEEPPPAVVAAVAPTGGVFVETQTRSVQFRDDGDNAEAATRAQPTGSGTTTRSSRLDRGPSGRLTRSQPDDSSDEDVVPDFYDGHVDTTTDEEGEEEKGVRILPFLEKPKGPRYRALSSLRAADPRFNRHMSYRFYRLMRRAQVHTFKQTGEIRGLIKRLNNAVGEEGFDGEDKVMILEFLIRLTEELDALAATEAQALIILPTYLKGDCRKLYLTARRGGSGAIRSWPEAVQWLLRTYATPAALREAVKAFRSLEQKPEEEETDYGNRVLLASHRCGDVFTDAEQMSAFVDGLLKTTRTLVARHRESMARERRSELTFSDLVSYAQDQGDAFRATRVTKATRPSGGILYAESGESSGPSYGVTNDEAEMFGLIPDTSSYSEELPSTVDDDASAILYGEQRVSAPRLAYENRFTRNSRPGWGANGRGQRGGMSQRAPMGGPSANRRLICYICYAIGHMASQCTCPLRDMAQVKRNFEALTREEQDGVPKKAYERALAFLNYVEPPRASVPPIPVATNTAQASEIVSSAPSGPAESPKN